MTLPETASSRWSDTEGLPFPLGQTRTEEEDACNFALYSKHAERVTLLLYTERDVVDPVFEYRFDYLKNKTGRVWHCRIPFVSMRGATYYAYRVEGPTPNGRFEWHGFDRDKILLDPYAKSVFFPPAFNRLAAARPGSNAGMAPLGVLAGDSERFDWQGDHRPRHEAGAVIYELHVRGFTRNPNSGIRDDARGTFAGLVEKIPYLKDLGVTVVELMPVFQYDPSDGNYWGYMPLNFFSPHHGYLRNWPNGHGNTDGTEENFSWNCGWEGDEGAPPEVVKLRKQQIKNFCCLLFLSNGTPMFRAGDEFMHTQAGNNNPYNQDDEVGWIDWDRLHANPDMFRFFKLMIAFGKAHPSLARNRFWREDIRWYGVGHDTDLAYDSRSLAFALHGQSQQDLDIYVMINAYWEELTFKIQEGATNAWRRVVDTSLESPFDFLEPGKESSLQLLHYRVPGRAVVMLVRDKDGAQPQ